MTFETIKKLHKHFKTLAEGNFNEQTFYFELENKKDPEESGRTSVGKMSQARIQLIRSDAMRHLTELKNKFPELKEKKDNSKKAK